MTEFKAGDKLTTEQSRFILDVMCRILSRELGAEITAVLKDELNSSKEG